MKNLIAFFLGIAILSISACAKKIDTQDIEKAIMDQHHQANQALTKGNLEALMSAYADDVIMMSPNQPELVGKAAVRSMWQDLLRDFTVQASVSTEEVKVLGEWAFERGTYTMELTPRAGGAPLQDIGKYLDILHQQPDGSYKYSRLCFNSSQAPNP